MASNVALKTYLDHFKTSGLCAKSSVVKNTSRGIRGSLGLVLQTFGLHPMKQTIVLPIRIDEDLLEDFSQSPWISKSPENLVEDVVTFFRDANRSTKLVKRDEPVVLELSLVPGQPIVYVSTTKDPDTYHLIWFPMSSKTQVLTESSSCKVFHGSSDDETFSRLVNDSEYKGPRFETRTTYETMNLSEDLLQIFKAIREFRPTMSDDSSSEDSSSDSDSEGESSITSDDSASS